MCASAELSSSWTAFSAAALALGLASVAVRNPSLYPAQRYASDSPENAGANVWTQPDGFLELRDRFLQVLVAWAIEEISALEIRIVRLGIDARRGGQP